MKPTLTEFWEAIAALPLSKKYEKEQLLVPEFLIEEEKQIQIYYAPHNEYINPEAKVFIVGITPGFQQMNDAIAAARQGIEEDKSLSEIQYLCKQAARFSGSMRKNLISMLDEVRLNEAFGLTSTSELFGEQDQLLHTVSLIPFSVFVKGANYTGHTPKLLKSEFLMRYVRENFEEELGKLNNKQDILIVPLGRAVEEVLLALSEEGILKKEQILIGFPHPSGANGNRLNQLKENKEQMTKQILSRY